VNAHDSPYETSSGGGFPLEFPARWESQAISEAFPWRPQTLFLLCVFGWLILWAFAYLFGYACFAFAAIVRSQLLLVWYWIPDGPEGRTRRVGLPHRRERALSSAR
jgi:hypothetical protein